MSNLLKKGSTISKSERVIDYNDLIRSKLQTILASENYSRAVPDGFVNGLNAEVVETLLTEDGAVLQDAPGEEAAAELQEQARQMVEEATARAQQIVAEANEQAQAAFAQAKVEGYQEGRQQASQELAKMKADLNTQYELRQQELETDYEEKRKKMEPELVAVLMDVFRKVTMTVAEDNQEVILHLINGVMRNAKTSREFIIKAAPEDYRFLVNNQGKIYCAMSKEVTLDIVEDQTLKRNECMIETDGGVFNCSLDIELNNLIKEIKLLSCL